MTSSTSSALALINQPTLFKRSNRLHCSTALTNPIGIFYNLTLMLLTPAVFGRWICTEKLGDGATICTPA